MSDSSDDEFDIPVGKLAIHDEDEEDEQVPTSTAAGSGNDSPSQPSEPAIGATCTFTHPEQDMVAELSQFDSFVNLLQSTNESELIRGCTGIRKLLSIERNPPIQRVIDSGSVPRLVQLMKESNSVAIQFETAWALTNIASGTSSQTRTIVNAGAIGVFVTLLAHANVDVREQAAWALGNIAGDSADHRDQVIRAGALQPLLSLATNSESRLMMIRNCAQAVSNMARGKPQPDFDELKAAIPVLSKLLFILDDEALSYTSWAISFLTDDNSPNNYKLRAITQVPHIVPRLIALLSHRQTDVKVPCLRSLGNIVAGDDEHTRMVIDAGGIPAFVKLLQSPKMTIRKETCWALSNCTDYLQTLIDAGVFPHVIRIVMDDDPEVGKQGMWILSNASTDATTAQMHYLVDQGIMEPFVDALDPECEDEVAQLVVEGLGNILISGADEFRHDPKHPHPYRDRLVELGVIESLRDVEAHHEHESVRAKAKQLLTKYFAGISPPTRTNADPKEDYDPKATEA